MRINAGRTVRYADRAAGGSSLPTATWYDYARRIDGQNEGIHALFANDTFPVRDAGRGADPLAERRRCSRRCHLADRPRLQRYSCNGRCTVAHRIVVLQAKASHQYRLETCNSNLRYSTARSSRSPNASWLTCRGLSF